MKALLLTSGALLSVALSYAAPFYPVVCRGGEGMELRYDPGRKLLVLKAYPSPQGADASPPGPGKCAWRDRPMTRPGETTRTGQLIFEIPVPGTVSVQLSGSGTTVRFSDPVPNKVWRGAARGGTFEFSARRKREGVYEVASRGGPRVEASPSGVPRATAAPSRPARSVSVEIMLTKIDVHSDADNVSPGDWKIIMTALKGNREFVTGRSAGGNYSGGTVQWPSRGTHNVSSGKSYSVNLGYYLHNVRSDDWISIYLVAVDCDSNDIFAVRSLGDLLPHRVLERFIRDSLKIQKCSGEEVWERSGAHDRVGKIIVLPPQDWRGGRTVQYRISGQDLDFTAHFRIRVLR